MADLKLLHQVPLMHKTWLDAMLGIAYVVHTQDVSCSKLARSFACPDQRFSALKGTNTDCHDWVRLQAEPACRSDKTVTSARWIHLAKTPGPRRPGSCRRCAAPPPPAGPCRCGSRRPAPDCDASSPRSPRTAPRRSAGSAVPRPRQRRPSQTASSSIKPSRCMLDATAVLCHHPRRHIIANIHDLHVCLGSTGKHVCCTEHIILLQHMLITICKGFGAASVQETSCSTML